MKAEFLTSAADTKGFIESDLPEVAFIGRSNVGKSSMINALLGRKKLVKVGNTPGKTKLINFFNIQDKYIFVDLPGYGYAKASKTERRKWRVLIKDYFTHRYQLSACVLILDIRRVPSEEDVSMIEMLSENKIPILLVATKSDKIPKSKREKHLRDISAELEIPETSVIPFSASKKTGIEVVWENIHNAVSEV